MPHPPPTPIFSRNTKQSTPHIPHYANTNKNDKNDDEDDDRGDDDTVVVKLSDPQYRNKFVRGRITGPLAPRIRRRVRRPSIRRSRGRPCRSGLLAYRCTRLG